MYQEGPFYLDHFQVTMPDPPRLQRLQRLQALMTLLIFLTTWCVERAWRVKFGSCRSPALFH